MAKSRYSELIKIAKKTDCLYVQKMGDIVYICNTHWILRTTEAAYNAYFRPESVRFPDLIDGQTMKSTGKSLPEPDNMNLTQFESTFYADCDPDIISTPFIYTDTKYNALFRIYKKKNEFICLDDSYACMADCLGYIRAYAGDRYGIVFDNDYDKLYVLQVNCRTNIAYELAQVIRED